MKAIVLLALALGVASAVGQGGAAAEPCSISGALTTHFRDNALRSPIQPGLCLRRTFLAVVSADLQKSGSDRRADAILDAHRVDRDNPGFLSQCRPPIPRSSDPTYVPFRVYCQLEPNRSPFDGAVQFGSIPACRCVGRDGHPVECPTVDNNGRPNSTVAPQRVVDSLNSMIRVLHQPGPQLAQNQRVIEDSYVALRDACASIRTLRDLDPGEIRSVPGVNRRTMRAFLAREMGPPLAPRSPVPTVGASGTR